MNNRFFSAYHRSVGVVSQSAVYVFALPAVLAAAAIVSTPSQVAYAIEPQAAAEPAGKALLLRATPDPNGTQVSVDVVDRSKINKGLFVDIIGLRL